MYLLENIFLSGRVYLGQETGGERKVELQGGQRSHPEDPGHCGGPQGRFVHRRRTV